MKRDYSKRDFVSRDSMQEEVEELNNLEVGALDLWSYVEIRDSYLAL